MFAFLRITRDMTHDHWNELEAQMLCYYHVEKWRCGTVQRVLAQVGLPRIGTVQRPSQIDAYLPFILETLKKFPSQTASRLCAMVYERGCRGGQHCFRHLISLHRPRPVALRADATDHEAVPFELELVLLADFAQRVEISKPLLLSVPPAEQIRRTLLLVRQPKLPICLCQRRGAIHQVLYPCHAEIQARSSRLNALFPLLSLSLFCLSCWQN